MIICHHHFLASVTIISFFVCLFWLQKRGWHFLASGDVYFLFCMSLLTTKEKMTLCCARCNMSFFVCLFWLQTSDIILHAGINPNPWVLSPGCALLAGCRCHPVLRDDTPHDALMWGRGGKHAGNPRSCASAQHVPWGQPRCTMGKSGRPNILSFAFFFVCLFWLQKRAWHCVAFAVACSFLYVFSDYKKVGGIS